MKIYNAGRVIQNTRVKLNLTQEQLCDGVCEPTTLSAIERGTYGVSPALFRTLMNRMGQNIGMFPAYKNRTEFDCYYALNKATYFIKFWKLQLAYDELELISNYHFANSRFIYQEWILLHCMLQIRSGNCDYTQVYELSLESLSITQSDFDFTAPVTSFLTSIELNLLICIGNSLLHMNKVSQSYYLLSNIYDYAKTSYLVSDTDHAILASISIPLCECLIQMQKYSDALALADKFRKIMLEEERDCLLIESTFATGLAQYFQHNIEVALTHLKAAYYSAHSIGSFYATICKNRLMQVTSLDAEQMFLFEEIPLVSFPIKKITAPSFDDECYDFSKQQYTLGNIIYDFRTSQNISQNTLCSGLCSKSTLSKIENSEMAPGAHLAQALLQRLGIYDPMFTFYAGPVEDELYTLKRTLNYSKDAKEKEVCMTRMAELIDPRKHRLYHQYYLYKQAQKNTTSSTYIENLETALNLTLTKFNFSTLSNYRFTWEELQIIVHILLAKTKPSTSISTTMKLCDLTETLENTILDPIYKSYAVEMPISILVGQLYNLRQFDELTAVTESHLASTLPNSLYFLAIIYGNAFQAYGELGKIDLCLKYAYYSYYNFLICEQTQKDTIKKFLSEDFNLPID